jgi:hypothetical protein
MILAGCETTVLQTCNEYAVLPEELYSDPMQDGANFPLKPAPAPFVDTSVVPVGVANWVNEQSVIQAQLLADRTAIRDRIAGSDPANAVRGEGPCSWYKLDPDGRVIEQGEGRYATPG